MTKPDVAVLAGVMSGTSLDGVTAAVARFAVEDGRHDVELLAIETIPYDEPFRARLAAAVNGAAPAEYNALNFELGARFADAVVAAFAAAGVARADIAAIASHGQTIWHAAPAGTWQLGEGAVIAERTGRPVIADFRVRDVAAGGQGAPLVTIADAMLFGRDDAARVLQNIGGIANLTVVPRRGATDGVRAFDTGPGVALMDTLVQRLLRQPFDAEGRHARAGTPVGGVVERLLEDGYFQREPPKSTGREQFGQAYALALEEACRAAAPGCSTADVLATAAELSARAIALAFERFVPDALADVLLSGGGAHNTFLAERIERLLAPRAVRRFDEVFFAGEAKEAVAFAYLGFLHLRGEAGNVWQATGARGPRVLGKLIPA